MFTAINAIIIFLLLVFVHELGHFIAAKSVGVKVSAFALGMGPALFKKKKGETEYSIRLLPIGGYCAMEGENESSEAPTALGNKKTWQRTVIMLSGAVMNIILGFLIFVIIFFIMPITATNTVNEITPNSGAAGILQVGDKITKIDNTTIHIFDDIRFQLSRNKSENINVEVVRNGQKHILQITPSYSEEQKNYIIGFRPSIQELSFAGKISNAYYNTCYMGKVVLVSFVDLLTGRLNIGELSGPVGIVNVIGTATNTIKEDVVPGILNLLYLMALITINLGVFNLLPFPALDGGRIVFILIEAVRRKKIDPEKEGIVHFIGFSLLILLIIFVTYKDIFRMFWGGA